MDLEKIRDFSKKYLEKNDKMHDWYHALRVYRLSKKISKEEGGDPEVLTAAAFLHDIGMWKDREDHEEVSVKLSKDILQDFEKNKRKNIIHCIRAHRFSKGRKPKTLESKIIQDADRLDALGVMGIWRALFHAGYFDRPLYHPKKNISQEYNGESETTIDHFYEKLLKIKDKLNTETAKKMAEDRHNFMEEFLERFFDEWEGKR